MPLTNRIRVAVVLAIALSACTNPGEEMIAQFPKYQANGQLRFDDMAFATIKSVRDAPDPTSKLKWQKQQLAWVELYGFGKVIECGPCGVTDRRGFACNALQLQSTPLGPVLWIYIEKTVDLPEKGASVAFEGCRIADSQMADNIGVKLGASIDRATDATWWFTCDAAKAPAPIKSGLR